MTSIDTFRTPRLTAKRLYRSDLVDLLRMHRDARVMETLGGHRSDRETRRFLDQNLAHWQHHGFGLWVFRNPGDGEFAGRGGLRRVEICGRKEIELAYALMAGYWGRGLATEMGQAILKIGFERIGLDDVVCFTWITNRASRRVMEKLGFAYERAFDHAGLPHVLCRLGRATWESGGAQA